MQPTRYRKEKLVGLNYSPYSPKHGQHTFEANLMKAAGLIPELAYKIKLDPNYKHQHKTENELERGCKRPETS